MSRINRTGTHPETKEKVNVVYGWDEVPGFKAGYFFQVENPKGEDPEYIVNEGFISGMERSELRVLAKKWKVRL